MTKVQIGRYSKYIRPISITLDLLAITCSCFFFFEDMNLDVWYYLAYQTIAWVLIAYFTKFYQVYRFTLPVEIISKLLRQGCLFLLIVIAFFPFAKSTLFSGMAVANFILFSFSLIAFSKYLLFHYLKRYRIITGSNYRNVIIVGYTSESIQLKEFFEKRNDYGYRFAGFFSDKSESPEIVGGISEIKSFVSDNKIDEIYCSLNEMSNAQLKGLVDFADENHKLIKFIPDSKGMFFRNLKIDYYEFFPVLTLQKTILHDPVIETFKRIFDIVFSLFVIVFVMSWLVPILAILIKLESKGPVFFKQGRPGIDEKEFFCFKFRSMKMNKNTEMEASKNDPRVTRIGRFIRKTSIDEIPQFLNVLRGDMSVVGPRPHLWSQNKTYSTKIKKYMVRHYVKPGITGLAQVKGFRGEIETDRDMVNRIKYDIYYIENWSLILDIKIIFQTVINIFKGEEKAY